MKFALILLCCCGCVGPNVAKVARELSRDNATVHIEVRTVYGTAI